jgi:hypothetical protein
MDIELIKRSWVLFVASVMMFAAAGCRSSETSGGLDILGPSDETAAAGEVIVQANEDLKKIKVLYDENEGKREELKKAMESNDAETVKKIANDVVYLINDGSAFGESAVKKVQEAQEMQINEDYREYLRLKEESLKRQMEAFENYRKAAQSLRDNYDPKNAQLREKVKEEFKQRSENYRTIMEEARDYSNRANELRKDTLRKQQN